MPEKWHEHVTQNKREKKIFFEMYVAKNSTIDGAFAAVLKLIFVDYSFKRVKKFIFGNFYGDGPLERANPQLFFSANYVKEIMVHFAR